MNEKRPRLLDLFCGAGGAAVGYHRAGFEVVGVDIKPQPHYPFEFHKGDALEFLWKHSHDYDAIHASPPCQAYSNLTPKNHKSRHPMLIGTADKKYLSSFQTLITDINIRRDIGSSQVSQMQRAIRIGQCGSNENLSG